MKSELSDEYYLNDKDTEHLKRLFTRTREVLDILRDINQEWYNEFNRQNHEVTILEDYNLRRTIKDPSFKTVDTLIIRKKLLRKWEGKISKKA